MWEYTQQEELYHYGVPGMRWGVRRAKAALNVANRHIKKSTGKVNNKLNKLNNINSKVNAKINKHTSKVTNRVKKDSMAIHKQSLTLGKAAAAPILAAVGKLPVSNLIPKKSGN